MKVTKNGTEVTLSKTELKLLSYFMNNPQQIITKEQLLSQIWDIDGLFVDPNTVAVNVRRLREKIEADPSNPSYIKTVRGIGYIWKEGCQSK
jgi:DNA-binding response OmpR family regulator